MFVVDAHGKLEGIVRAEKASKCVEQNRTSPEDLIDTDVRTVKMDTPLQEIVPMMVDTREPVAVVDENNVLKGVVVIGALLAGLSEKEVEKMEEKLEEAQ